MFQRFVDAELPGIHALIAELFSALQACRERHRLQRQLEDAIGNSGIPEGWLGAVVGGRVFNGIWGEEPGDRPEGPGDPGDGGVLESGDPGADGVLQPGDPGYGGGG